MSQENDAVSTANKLKALSGQQQISFLKTEFDKLLLQGVITSYETDTNFRHPDYTYDKQFLANFVIHTTDKKVIVVRSSNSFRSDRAKIGFYDLEGILSYSEFKSEIIAAVYLVPDSEGDARDFKNIREKVESKEYYTPATHLLTVSEFTRFLEEYAYEQNREEEVDEEPISTELTASEKGSQHGKNGNEFERTVVSLLNDPMQLKSFKLGEANSPLFGLVVNQLLNELAWSGDDLLQVTATNSIPLLKSGGNPKTDVAVRLNHISGETVVKTMSLKFTTAKRVSCHDYQAGDFIRVLGCEGTRLAEYLELFQQNPSYSSFESSLKDGFSSIEFEGLLAEKQPVFNEWVLMGRHDEANLVKPSIQVSTHILICQNENLAFYPSIDYIKLISRKSKLAFGVPFGWTYPSKQRTKRIQLKLPIII